MMNNSQQKIIPHLWFDNQAEEAGKFYTSLFEDSKIGNITRYSEEGQEVHGQEAGTVMTMDFELAGQKFIALNGGPHFKFTPAISFYVTCETEDEVNELWQKLSEGGTPLMPLNKYDLPAPLPKPFYVYVIKCENDSNYIGQTDNLLKRWERHKNGTASNWTKRNKPVEIIHHEGYETRNGAVKREKELKTGFGRKWIKREYEKNRLNKLNFPEARQTGWSEKYGWVQDKYGLTWQISLGKLEDVHGQKIIPSLMFVNEEGLAEEAINLYTSLFDDTSITGIMRYGPDEDQPEGSVMHSQFRLNNGEVFMAMDSSPDNADFTFNEAVSLLIQCEDQEEIDHFWNLSSVPEAEQCGWLKDKFGVSWQVIPVQLSKMLDDSDSEKVERVTEAFLQMKKFDIQKLQEVYNGH